MNMKGEIKKRQKIKTYINADLNQTTNNFPDLIFTCTKKNLPSQIMSILIEAIQGVLQL